MFELTDNSSLRRNSMGDEKLDPAGVRLRSGPRQPSINKISQSWIRYSDSITLITAGNS